MLTVEEDPVFVAPGDMYAEGTGFEGHAFFEASSIRKRGDIYYFVYSSQVMHELCYATSSSPRGPFKYGGVIVSNNDIGIDTYKAADRPVAFGGNNHGSIVEIAGQWYIFYHRQTNGTWFSRQGCAEPICFDEDGRIRQAEITSCGLNGAPLKGEGTYPAYIACHLFVEKDQPLYIGEPGYPKVTQDGRDDDKIDGHIADIGDGTTIGFKYFDCRGVRRIGIETRAYAHGVFQVKASIDGEVLAEIPVDGTNVWFKRTAEVAFPDGRQALYLTYRGTGKAHLKSVSLEK